MIVKFLVPRATLKIVKSAAKKAALSIGVLVATTMQAQCWDHRGHAVVAEIAERHLSPSAFDEISRLLGAEGKSSLVEVASWADRIKAIAVPPQPNHTVKLAAYGPYIPEKHCPRGNCILSAISADINALQNPEVSDDAKIVALKYLVHFVGDIHQPLHATVLGRDVAAIYKGKELSLHRVWDRTILSIEKGGTDELADMVENTAPKYDSSNPLTPLQWAMESRDIVRDVILPSLPSYEKEAPFALSRHFLEANVGLVNSRLNLAGRRLADILNRIF